MHTETGVRPWGSQEQDTTAMKPPPCLTLVDSGSGLVAKSCLTLATPMGVACQAPLFTGFPRQEHWSGLPFPSPGDRLNPGIEPESPWTPSLQVDSLPTELQGKSNLSRFY